MRNRNLVSWHFLLVLTAILTFGISIAAQSTAFSYQGFLQNGGNPANGNYEMQFKLFDALAGGGQVGGTVTDASVAVINGSFAAILDFGPGPFNSGSPRYLEIAVRTIGNPDPFVILAPRQPINSAPYAILSKNALQLGGVSANQYVLTGDARLSDPRNPLAGSTSYIQNQNAAPQATSNFNISGNGTLSNLAVIGNSTVGSLNVNGTTSLGGIAPPATAPAGQGRIYFDSASNRVRISENNGAYVNLVGSGISGTGTVNSIPFWSGATTLGNSLISQDNGVVRLPNLVSMAVGGTGGQVSFGAPNGETGMLISGTNRADIRFNGSTLRLAAGPAGSPPFGGIGIETTGVVRLPSIVTMEPVGTGGQISFAGPNGETGMTIAGANGRADIRFDGSTLRILNGPAGVPPANGIAINNTGNVSIGPNTSLVSKLNVISDLGASAIGTRGFSFSGTGVFGQTASGVGVRAESIPGGIALLVDGNAIQTRDNGGLVKSMMYVTYTGGAATVVRCFDGITNQIAPPCAIAAIRNGDFITIGYSYQIADRFISLTPTGGSPQIVSISGTQIVFVVGSGTSGSFFLYVY